MKKNRIFLLLCCALLPALLRAQAPQERESILIISSYNPDTRRMSGFIAEFERNIVPFKKLVREAIEQVQDTDTCDHCRAHDGVTLPFELP